MEEIKDLSIIAGEAEVKLQWKASDNPFITGYTITRRDAVAEDGILRYNLEPNESRVGNAHQFINTDVIEEETYTYEVAVLFKSGAELRSERFTVKVLPVIEATRLLQSYPNPFNPETWIPYELAKDADVTIGIYSVSGQLGGVGLSGSF